MEGVLRELSRAPKLPASKATEQQARWLARRIAKTWLASQIALIDAGLALLEAVVLHYLAIDGGTTMFERFQSHQRELN